MLPRMYCSGKFFEPTVIVPASAAPSIFWISEPGAVPPPPPPPEDELSSSSPQAAAPRAMTDAARNAVSFLFEIMMLSASSFVGMTGGPCEAATAPPP